MDKNNNNNNKNYYNRIMQSKYNEFSKIQLETIKNNSKLIEKSICIMIENIKNGKFLIKNNNDSPVRILDIGSSHGRNSITPLNIIISNILKQNPKQCFEVYHEDLPSNDFSRLFNEISQNSQSYLKLSNQIYYYGIGKTFYNQVVPSNSIDYIFSFSASHWSSYNEEFYKNPDSLLMIYRERTPEYTKHCLECLFNNFSSRAKELKNGGIFIITIMNENEDLSPEENTVYQYFKLMKDVWYLMVKDNLVPKEVVEKMMLPINFYKKSEIYQVIDMVEKQEGLKLVSIDQNVQTFHNVELSDLDKAELLFKYINVASEPTIKSFLPGDQRKKDLLYKVFKIKFLTYLKTNKIIPINNLYSYYSIIFEKDC
ncbi:hypothetical protein DICPUDRAFT_75678 [Dictyostelium purpureum]|uniref:SAM dependent carboxyl methyltransferase n=1 Tax=Dictyostelium purpureum TaxID=5786 RepID=F0ZBC8_DICPU|nr:uncharacterized protein DICPUDRAFT_75678 [Dictyostelium purpureum]EGC38723.1 hypothetical protein DICPUDRAFT_75678 [Dictyostelium purpureum]|eukprot:XP_003284714.1 hypothetical protein DICPUDRAFT_75678 [Dictyostelium purpureum]